MTIKQRSRTVAVAAAGGVLVALALAGAAQAVTDTVFKYSTPKTAHLSLSAGAFANENFSNLPNYQSTLGMRIAPGSTGVACGSAGVNLPQGAVVTSVAWWGKSDSTSFPLIEFLRINMATGGSQALVSASLGDTDQVREKEINIPTASMATIANQTYWYEMRACVDPTARFYGVRITYTYTKAGD